MCYTGPPFLSLSPDSPPSSTPTFNTPSPSPSTSLNINPHVSNSRKTEPSRFSFTVTTPKLQHRQKERFRSTTFPLTPRSRLLRGTNQRRTSNTSYRRYGNCIPEQLQPWLSSQWPKFRIPLGGKCFKQLWWNIQQ